MRCPYCKNPSQPHDPQCRSCGLSFQQVGRLFGALPHVKNGLNDRAMLLSRSKRSKIEIQLKNIETQFPQVHVTVLIEPGLEPETPFGAYSFWIFNSPGVCRGLEKGAMNHAVLLTVDSTNRRANLIVGYGLEPYFGESHLHQMLACGQEAFSNGEIGEGIGEVLKGVTVQLHSLIQSLETVSKKQGVAPVEQRKKKRAKEPAY
jgi:uncharacterized membrane protein YgcG